MRTARRVIVCLLSLCAAAGLWAQQTQPAAGAVDSSVTVVGRDDSVISVPAPAALPDSAAAPLPDPLLAGPGGDALGAVMLPPVFPPIPELALPPAREGLVLPDQLRQSLQ